VKFRFLLLWWKISIFFYSAETIFKKTLSFTGEERRIPFIFDDFHFCHSRVIELDMMENRIFTLCRMITWVVFLRMFWNFTSSLSVKRGGSLSFLTIFTFAVPELLDLIWQKIGFLLWHRVKILFSVISSPITLERQKWKSSKMKGILLSSPISCW
jgi:hypothetical protein